MFHVFPEVLSFYLKFPDSGNFLKSGISVERWGLKNDENRQLSDSTTQTYAFLSLLAQYAVKAQTSLAPLSRFCGSRITTAHEQQCCRFQLCKDCAVANEIDKRN